MNLQRELIIKNQPRQSGRFPRNYIIDRDDTGKPYPKTAQVARCGNAVPPPFAEALFRANLPELCAKHGESYQQISLISKAEG